MTFRAPVRELAFGAVMEPLAEIAAIAPKALAG
jgi:hypothetical protein